MITVAIPTYERGAILVETLGRLLQLETRANAIVVVDQTATHPDGVARELERLDRDGAIRWIRLAQPSIPRAMNEALLAATTPLVLFLDDDIVPSPSLIEAHLKAHEDDRVAAVVGQILQPGEEPQHYARPPDDLEFHFNHDEAALVTNVMAGNLSVKRERAIAAGGFDENYIGAAYRFESDFALRLAATGDAIRFEPAASLRHLKLSSGGLRAFGDHRTTASPLHAVGDYYFAFTHRRDHFARYSLRRLVKNIATRFHLRHPWTIPAKLTGELRAIMLARSLARRGALLIGNSGADGPIQRNER
jgi:GT2 family glycosyltransferase